MTENEKINGWTFGETIKTTENLMEAESNMFKWDVLRHLRDFAENYKDELEEYRAIGTVEEFKALKEKSVAKKPDYEGDGCWDGHVVIDTWMCPNCEKHYEVDYDDYDYCPNCGQHIDHSGLTEDD